jgi:thiol-disulfide isomerase/thioredoxin
MDRLSALIIVALAACDSTPAAPPASRTDGAKVAAPAAPDAFCDFHPSREQAPAFRWPQLADGAPPADARTWRWVNVWATWCKPCLEEMPRLVAWQKKLAAAGTPVELTFVAVDEADAVAAFRKDHPEAPPSLRVAGLPELADWLKAFGIGEGAITLPLHLFVAPDHTLRCGRSGGVGDKHYAAVAHQLSG